MFDVPSFHTANGSLLLAHEYLNGTDSAGLLLHHPWEVGGGGENLSSSLQAASNQSLEPPPPPLPAYIAYTSLALCSLVLGRPPSQREFFFTKESYIGIKLFHIFFTFLNRFVISFLEVLTREGIKT